MLFRLYDCDGDGRVSREDVEKVVEAMYGMVGPLLAQERGEGEEEGTDTGRETENKAEDVSAMVSARVKEIFQTLDKVYMYRLITLLGLATLYFLLDCSLLTEPHHSWN